MREIMDELNKLGGLTADHHVLITELVATCLCAGQKPAPRSGAERQADWRARNEVTSPRYDETAKEIPPTPPKENTTPNNPTDCLPPKPRKRAGPLPEDWNPTEDLLDRGKSELGYSDSELKFQTDKFRDHFLSVGGAKSLKTDWGRCWMNWLRNARDWGQKGAAQSNVTQIWGPRRTYAEIKAEKAQA